MRIIDKRWYAVGLTLIVVGLVGLAAIALADNNSTTRTCPDGQTPGLTRVNGDTFSQAKPPPGGGSITDSVSGSGVDYSVRSDRDSVTLSVHGPGSATFEVACR
jgi:hypothetical protein